MNPISLEELLKNCAVKLTVPGRSGWGTGFWVAPGYILTCEHVVHGEAVTNIQVRWGLNFDFAKAEVEMRLPKYDIALLSCETHQTLEYPHPCVWFGDDPESRDKLYLFGYPDQDFPDGSPAALDHEGLTGSSPPEIKFSRGQVRPGFSGAPLLNQQTGKLCGMVKFTLGSNTNLGGGAIPVSVLRSQLPTRVLTAQEDFHRQDNRWQKFLPILNASERGSHFNVPKLKGSAVFVERKEENQKVVDALLSKKDISNKPIIGILGSPGYGKTTLAIMVCHQASIRKHYTGGIFWVEFNDTTDAKEEITKIYRSVTGISELEVQPFKLSSSWKKEPTLIILDNVQSKEVLSLFLESNADCCQWLITTQKVDIFETSENCEFVQVSSLKKEEIITVLRTALKIPSENNSLHHLADLLYNWPILLNVILQRIQQLKRKKNASSEDILDELTKEIKSFDWLDFDDENKIKNTVEKSLQYLSIEEKEFFQKLFIFSPDLDIPFSIIENIWKIPLHKVKKICLKLDDLSLIKGYNVKRKSIQLNDYIRRYFLSDSRLKKKLIQTNIEFVDFYTDKYNAHSLEGSINTLTTEEKKFLSRVYKYQCKRARIHQKGSK